MDLGADNTEFNVKTLVCKHTLYLFIKKLQNDNNFKSVKKE